ncbi:hypothetical protein [Serratia marcescens]|uniref:hypothetical protein n=1 Tax=Serratia marcescens TaxID=615 RepID=UPI001F413800|nr:hypothetical protein [Serratia marcescens]
MKTIFLYRSDICHFRAESIFTSVFSYAYTVCAYSICCEVKHNGNDAKICQPGSRLGIHADALLVVDSSATPVHGSIIVAAEEGAHVLRRLRLYPYRALEFLDGSGRETELGNEDSEEGIEVFGVVMYCVNDMRSCEWDDLPVI